MRLLLGIYFWVVGYALTCVLYLVVLWRQVRIALFGRPRDGRPIHAIATLWGRTLIKMTPGWRVSVEGLENVPEDGDPVVVVANHESMADIWAMYYLGMQFRWLSKIEVKRAPIVGRTMVWAGYVFIRRGDKASHIAAMEQSHEVLKSGISMFFFPEGTRSRDGNIQPFKIGAFKMAKDAKVDILPVAIHGAGNLLPKGSVLPGRAHVRVRVLERVKGPEDGDDLDQYAAKVRQKIIEAHSLLK